MLKRLLWLLIILSLIPAFFLVVKRIRAEGSQRTVTLVMDEQALATQAEYYGMTAFELGEHYRTLGLNGVAIYEETVSSFAAKDEIVMLFGSSLKSEALLNGLDVPDLPSDSLLLTELQPGSLGALINKVEPKPEELEFSNRDWYVFQGVNASRPVGPRRETIQEWSEAGWDIAYRPRSYPNMVNIGADYPPEAHYLIYHGLQVAGHPGELDDVVRVSQNYITGIIEGTPQEGMQEISQKIPTARVLSFNQDYINEKLSPQDLVDKYLLAANERGIRILYLRPYIETQQGDMLQNTDEMLTKLVATLEGEGYKIGPLPVLEFNYHPSPLLRALSSIGIIAALILLALLYPGIWGVLVALAVAALGLLAGKLDWDALALIAALSFPVLGYGYFSKRLINIGLATLISLAGVVLLAAVGSDQEAMMAIRPFAGVAATLVIPPALFLFHYALKYRRPAAWLTDFWQAPIQLGHVIIFMLGIAALGLIVLRRGNFPIIGASEAELALRQWLSGLFVRPRFKELIGHPLGVLGLANRDWPEWIRALLLTGGVISQATIMNSFSHYHTPLLISLQRTLIALIIGLIIGFVALPLVRLTIRLVRRWLASAPRPRQA
ncbi:MAG: hypothetical protein KC422_00815 [Trueperaceae bacterium]|nr:hypothetical protein [Trueperaceae bacterium]